MGCCCTKIPKETPEEKSTLIPMRDRKSSNEKFKVTTPEDSSPTGRHLSQHQNYEEYSNKKSIVSAPRSFQKEERELARKQMFDKIHQGRNSVQTGKEGIHTATGKEF
jgi:hypothetical protein